MNRAENDGNTVLVVAGFESAADARALQHNSEFASKMEVAGVLDTPRFEIDNQVEAVDA